MLIFVGHSKVRTIHLSNLLPMGTKKKILFLLFLGLVAEVDAQLRLSQLDLSRATQTYGTLVTGRSVTGEEAFVAGEKCEDPVGVHSKSIIRINVKGSAVRLSGKIGVTDTQIDYHSSEVTASPQPDGTRVLFHQVNGQKYLAGVEDQGNTMKKGVVMFRVLETVLN